MTRREPAQVRSGQTRDRILSAALEVLAERGMAGVTHREVAQRAGVSLSATTYYFGSGAELERAAIETHYAARIADYAAITTALTESNASPAQIADAMAQLLTSSSLDLVLGHFEVYLNSARRDDLRSSLAPALAAFRELAEAVATTIGIDDAPRFATAAIAIIEGVELRRLAEGIDGREELASSLRLLAIGALAQQGEPTEWQRRLDAVGRTARTRAGMSPARADIAVADAPNGPPR